MLFVLKVDDVMIVSLFTTADNSLMVQDMFPLDAGLSQLIAFEIPYYYFGRKVHFANVTLLYLDFVFI